MTTFMVGDRVQLIVESGIKVGYITGMQEHGILGRQGQVVSREIEVAVSDYSIALKSTFDYTLTRCAGHLVHAASGMAVGQQPER